jgi:anti-sigma factor RsiW
MNVFDRLRRTLGLRPRPAPLACIEMVELITDYLEECLPPAARARFESHLGRCEGCQAYVEQMRQTVQAVGRLSEETIPPHAMDELLQAFGAWRQG